MKSDDGEAGEINGTSAPESSALSVRGVKDWAACVGMRWENPTYLRDTELRSHRRKDTPHAVDSPQIAIA